MPGAGFFLAPGRVITCQHVIGEAQSLRIVWEQDDGPPAEFPVRDMTVLESRGRPIPALAQDYPDVAVLGFDDPGGHPCVAVDLEWPSQEDVFLVFGYPKEGGAVLLTPAKLTYRGTHGTRPTAFLDLASDTIKPGMSGAAVLNLRPGAVSGIIVASKHTSLPDGALVVPWSAVAPEVADILAENRQFHTGDPRWQAAASAYRERLRFRLPRTVSHFTGRDDVLRQLDSAFTSSLTGVITQTVSGLGGVGKTQLAAAYVEAREPAFDIVAWIRAEDGGTRDLADLAVALGLPTADRTPEERSGDALVFLANTERTWLLVLDNVPGPEALRDLPRSGTGRVLVTSRHRGGYEVFGTEVPIDVLDEEAAVSYLVARSGRAGEVQEARAVASALGRLPLAIAHAAAYCSADTGVGFADYLELVEGLPAQELFDTNREVFYYETVAATWDASISAAAGDAPLARRALGMAAWLAPDAIPRGFFAGLGENSAIGRKRTADALAAIHRYSLAAVTESGVTVHRLLQKVVREQMTEADQEQALTDAIAALDAGRPGDPRLPEMWAQWQELIPHAEVLASLAGGRQSSAQRLIGVLNEACEFLLSSGAPARLLALSRATALAADRLLDPDSPVALTARRNLAAACESAGLHTEAVELGHQVIADSSRLLGPGDLGTLQARVNLTLALESARRGREAIEEGKRLTTDCDHLLGPDHRLTLTAYDQLAASLMPAGWVREAITISERVLDARERLLGPDHPDTMTARDNLAVSYRSAGRTRDAIAIGEQLASDRERILGTDHPATINARYSLASSYRSAGRISDAIAVEERVVTDRTRILGADHPDTLWARGNLGLSYESAGRTSDAVNLAAAVAADCERVLGIDDPHTLTARANLAISLRSAGRVDEAIPMQEQLIADRQRVIGPDHPSTLSGWDHLGISYRRAGRLAEAITTARQTAATRARVLGTSHPAALVAGDNLSACYLDAGQLDEAIELSSQVVGLLSEVLGASHPETLWARQGLADAHSAAGRLDDAVAMNQEILQDCIQVLGTEHPYADRARRGLALAYRATGRDDKADAVGEYPRADCERILWE